MSKLYEEWAPLYDMLYAELFNYDAEFEYYDRFLKNYGCGSVLKYGCGTGRLASHLINAGYDYIGVDASVQMVDLAQSGTQALVYELVRWRLF